MTIPAHYVDVHEAGRVLGRHPETIRTYIKNGTLTRHVVDDKTHAFRIDPDELDRLPRHKRFWEQVTESESGCWIWTGRLVKGYGMHNAKLAHRLAYEEMIGAIPDGLELDHLCVTPPCVNPYHLEPVTRLVNMRRRFDLLTHCKNGHEFTPENTYLREGHYRACRACNSEARRRYVAKKAA